ncbi:MAG: tripartite tricarboxylate transporter substrate binding protein [Burkholderiales bacterium]|nr:tripartite tricarboxylate transporter substrate binding protein [Burkholderiales bacterium]
MKTTAGSVLGLTLLALATGSLAQGYPDKPIRWIIDFPAAGVSDILARIVGGKLSESLGQAIVYDNRPGANGIIANEMVAKAPPDGYTLGFISQPFSLQLTVQPKLAFTLDSFAPVGFLAMYPSLLVVHPRSPANSVKEFIAYAKGKKPPISYASSGAGGAQHLSMEIFRKRAGFDAVHVPYAGSQASLVDLIGGRVDATFANVPGALPHIRGNRLKAIAVAAPARARMLSEVPTFAEHGFPLELLGYAGAVVPAGTARPIIAKLNAEIGRVIRMADVQERIYNAGGEPRAGTPEEFGAYLRKDVAFWAPVIRETGATTQN